VVGRRAGGGGSPGMTGAAAMCARAAYRAGAGMVRLGVPGAALSESPATEAVSVSLPGDGWSTPALEVASRCSAVVSDGPGPRRGHCGRRGPPGSGVPRAGGGGRRRALRAGQRRGWPSARPSLARGAHPARRGVPPAHGRGSGRRPGRGGASPVAELRCRGPGEGRPPPWPTPTAGSGWPWPAPPPWPRRGPATCCPG